MFSNSATSASRPLVVTVYTSSCVPLVGAWPIRPAANCAFCSVIARVTSAVVSLSCDRRSGLSQIRIA